MGTSVIVILLLLMDLTTAKMLLRCPVPRPCEYGCDFSRHAMHCNKVMLGPYSPELPDNHENVTWHADFSGNYISTLQNLAFYTASAEVVLFHFLNYSNNYIDVIQPEAFKGLSSTLRILALSNNNLKYIPQTAFQNLTNLHHLYLDSNMLNSIDFVCKSQLPKLYQLFLFNNSLSEISAACFFDTKLGLKGESQLSVSSNYLMHLDACTFQGRQFQQFDFEDNNFLCMCNLRWLTDYNSNVSCWSSEDGELMLLSQYSSFYCDVEAAYDLNDIECHDLEVEAFRTSTGQSNATVALKWQVRNFLHLKHFKILLFAVGNNSVSGIGTYPVKNRKYRSIIIPNVPIEPSENLIVCVEAAERLTASDQTISLIPVQHDKADRSRGLLRGTFLHTRCETAEETKLPTAQAIKSSNGGSTGSVFTPVTILLVVLVARLY